MQAERSANDDGSKDNHDHVNVPDFTGIDISRSERFKLYWFPSCIKSNKGLMAKLDRVELGFHQLEHDINLKNMLISIKQIQKHL